MIRDEMSRGLSNSTPKGGPPSRLEKADRVRRQGDEEEGGEEKILYVVRIEQ